MKNKPIILSILTLITLILSATILAQNSTVEQISTFETLMGQFTPDNSTDIYMINVDESQITSLQILGISGGLIPEFKIFDSQGSQLPIIQDTFDTQGSTRIVFPNIGQYRLEITSASGSSGEYILSTKMIRPYTPNSIFIPDNTLITDDFTNEDLFHRYWFSTDPAQPSTVIVYGKDFAPGVVATLRNLRTSEDVGVINTPAMASVYCLPAGVDNYAVDIMYDKTFDLDSYNITITSKPTTFCDAAGILALGASLQQLNASDLATNTLGVAETVVNPLLARADQLLAITDTLQATTDTLIDALTTGGITDSVLNDTVSEVNDILSETTDSLLEILDPVVDVTDEVLADVLLITAGTLEEVTGILITTTNSLLDTVDPLVEDTLLAVDDLLSETSNTLSATRNSLLVDILMLTNNTLANVTDTLLENADPLVEDILLAVDNTLVATNNSLLAIIDPVIDVTDALLDETILETTDTLSNVISMLLDTTNILLDSGDSESEAALLEINATLLAIDDSLLNVDIALNGTELVNVDILADDSLLSNSGSSSSECSATPHNLSSNINVRLLPTVAASVVAVVDSSDTMTILGKATGDTWLQIELADGQRGFASASVLDIAEVCAQVELPYIWVDEMQILQLEIDAGIVNLADVDASLLAGLDGVALNADGSVAGIVDVNSGVSLNSDGIAINADGSVADIVDVNADVNIGSDGINVDVGVNNDPIIDVNADDDGININVLGDGDDDDGININLGGGNDGGGININIGGGGGLGGLLGGN